MSRTSLMFVALFAIAYASLFGYSYATRTQPARAEPGSRVLAASDPDRNPGAQTAAAPLPAQRAAADVDSEAASRPAISADVMAKWIAEATGDDAEKRSAAITALAMAPKSAAVPVLKSVLDRSSDTDKQLVLDSLRTLALREGDADGGIRDAIRQVIYHGSDAAFSSAQTVLDEVEGGLDKTSVTASP